MTRRINSSLVLSDVLTLVLDEAIRIAAVERMNDTLYAASSASGESHGMCTTLVAAVELRQEGGDILVPCTDGLSDSLPLEEIIATSMADEPAATSANLVTAAQGQGGTDDVSVIVARVSAKDTVDL